MFEGGELYVLDGLEEGSCFALHLSLLFGFGSG